MRMRNRLRFFTVLLPLVALSLFLPACIEKQPVRGLAVNVILSDRALTDDLVTGLKVKYITTAAFKPFDKDYRVVALAYWQDKILFRESLDPETPPVKWQAGRVYEVEKYLYFPAVIDPFNRRTASGVKIEFKIVLENGSGNESVRLFSRKIKLLPRPADSPDVVFLNGWEKLTRSADASALPRSEYWTTERAVCLLKNTGRPALLMIKGRNYADRVTVSLYLDEGLLEEFQLGPGEFRKIYRVGPFPLTTDPEIYLTIAVDRTMPLNEIYPDCQENSRVGVRIDRVYFR